MKMTHHWLSEWCFLFSTKPLPEPVVIYQLDSKEQTSMKFESIWKILFITRSPARAKPLPQYKNAFENVVCKMFTNLFWPQYMLHGTRLPILWSNMVGKMTIVFQPATKQCVIIDQWFPELLLLCSVLQHPIHPHWVGNKLAPFLLS